MADANVNVRAYHNIANARKVLYTGQVFFRERASLLSGILPFTDFLKSLEDVGKEVSASLVKETQDWSPARKRAFIINYSSSPIDPENNCTGYTHENSSFLVRPLKDSEMEKLIKEVDSRIRPLFYKKSK